MSTTTWYCPNCGGGCYLTADAERENGDCPDRCPWPGRQPEWEPASVVAQRAEGPGE